MTKLIFLYLVLVTLLLSLLAKVSIIDHNFPNNFTLDTQHVTDSMFFYKDIVYENKESFLNRWFKLPHKYPLGLPALYSLSANFFMPEFSRSQFLYLCRAINISLLILLIIGVVSLNLSKPLKWTAVLILSSSLITHQYSTILKIHFATGCFTFFSSLLALYAIHRPNPLIYLLFAGAFSGFAAGCFFSGGISLLTILFVIIHLAKNSSVAKSKLWSAGVLSCLLFVAIFSLFYPSFLKFIQGESPFFGSSDYDILSIQPESSAYTPQSFLVYWHALCGSDLLLGLGCLLGLIRLFKNFRSTPIEIKTLSLTIAPYFLFMGFVPSHGIRHLSLILAPLSLLSAYGWLAALDRVRLKIFFRALFFLLFIFNLICILRYNYLSQHDTRKLAFEHIVENFPENAYFLTSYFSPLSINHNYNYPQKKFTIIDLKNFRKTIQHLHTTDTAFVENMAKAKLTPKDFKNPETYYRFIPLLHIKYFVTTNTRDDPHLYPGKDNIVKNSQLIEEWAPLKSGESYSDWFWPNTSHYLLWRMWQADRAGPTVRIYKLSSS